MTEFETKMTVGLAELKSKIEEIQGDLKRDYKVLHGNGSPGLIHRVTVLEHNMKWIKWIVGAIGTGIGIVGTNLKEWIK